MVWQKLPKPSTLWEEGEKWFELEDNLEEGKFDFLEYKEEPPPKGIILQRDVSVAMGPETLGTPGDFSRIWVAFTHQETGEIYLARSDDEWNQWEEYIHIIYAPSGSYQPSLTFGQDGWHRMAVTLIPAGEEIPEVWIIEPPYSGDGIRRLDLGEHPKIFRDYWGNYWVFYYKPEIGAIYSKSSKDNFTSATEINLLNKGYPPLGARLSYWEVTPYHDRFRHVLFFGSGKNMPFYVASQIEDIYTVGLDLYVTRWNGSPLEEVIVEVEGQSGITNKKGLVTFYKLPYNIIAEIKLSHPSLGMGDTQHIFIPESAKGTHVTHALFFTKPKKKENLGVRTGLKRIEWVGTIYELRHRIEKLSSYINLRVEWESMLIPAYMLVYSGNIYEPVYSLRHHYVGGSRREALVWQEKGQFADQDVTVDIYAGGSKRPGIALRCSGSSGRENCYVGYFRHPTGDLEILRYTNGTSRSLVTKSMNILQNKWYTLRMQAIGDNLKLKIWEKDWEKDTEEPETWDIETTDSAITSGYAGVFDYDGNGTSYWANYSLNGELADFSYLVGDLVGNMPVGWTLQFGTASRWSTEIKSVEVWDIEAVPGATVQMGDQTSQTNQEGLAPFYDLQGGSVQSYEITHPNYPEISTGVVLIPEGEFDFIPMKIYEKPWDGHALEEVKVYVDLDVNLVAINIEYRQPIETVSVSVGLTNILWVEVTE